MSSAARSSASLAGFENVITFDMGGTSADLALVADGKPTLAPEWRVDWNIPILFPAIDLVAIGAGGGTIAWVDTGGSLRAGPQSAGADPGPACFDKGNTEPTITDAHLFLGRLNPESYLGGDLEIRPELAEQAIERLAARARAVRRAETASGILRIANANMTSATHLISVERGHDPRDFALVAGGGAGPLHAVEIARELGIPQVVVPPTPGVTSALGILQVDLRHDLLAPVLKQVKGLEGEDLVATFDRLRDEATQILDAEDIAADRRSHRAVGRRPLLRPDALHEPAHRRGARKPRGARLAGGAVPRALRGRVRLPASRGRRDGRARQRARRRDRA